MNIKKLIPLNRFFWLMPITVGVICLTATLPAVAQEQILRTLTVTGKGVEMVSTTIAEVNLGVEIQGKTAAQVQQEVAKRTSAVVDLLKSLNVEQLQTTGIRLQPNYQYINNQRNLVGYVATNTVSFQLSTEKVGALIDQAVTAGATRIDSIRLTATVETLATAQQEALRQATLNAQTQADTVLNALNLTAKDIVKIEINGARTSPPQPIQSELLSATTADVSTPVIGGEQKVSAFVTLQISY
ncbi:MAG: SIMPL domain-containing protein [Xenococcus sp. (in: cyanobacteria)]